MITPKFFATIIKTGEIIYKNLKGYRIWIAGLSGKEVEVTIKEKGTLRSVHQNAWLWGIAYKMICDETDQAKESIHALLTSMFLKEDYWFKEQRYEIVRSTTDLTTKEFTRYMAQVQQWAAEELNLDIPSPNEVSYDDIIIEP